MDRRSDRKTQIKVGARGSSLSRAQVQEVLIELQKFHPEIVFETVFVTTGGDKDLTTSLRTIPQGNNFFTKEIDELQLQNAFRISIHSAKDLSDPLPKGLTLVALTRGQDPRDSLVLREHEGIDTLPQGARIATSSIRRDEAIQALRKDFICVDIRGTIEKRLSSLFEKKVDGVVIAEAAIIRLHLTHLNRIFLDC